MIRVADAAEQLGVSRGTIYRKIKELSPELSHYVFKKNNVTVIDSKGVELIRNNLFSHDETMRETTSETEGSENVANESVDAEQQATQSEVVKDLRKQITRLENELDIKNQQFNNFQILLKNEQDRSLLLEYKLEEKSPAEETKSIWERILGSIRKSP